MANKKKTKQQSKFIGSIPLSARLAIFVVIAAVMLVSLFWQNEINFALGLTKTGGGEIDSFGTGSELNVHFVNVGQGDACVIELPDGKNMLIDSGSSDSDNALIKYIEKNVKGDDGKTIGFFDIVILTHSDEDHCGEMADVLERFPAKTFYRPNQEATRTGFVDPGKSQLYGNYSDKNTLAYANAIRAGYAGFAGDNGARKIVTDATKEDRNVIKSDDKKKGDENYYEINFYSPTLDVYTNKNDYSPILVLEYNGNRIALSGDAEAEAEREFVRNAAAREGKYSVFTETFTVQAIKLGHHGSRTSSSKDYLETMTTAASRADVKVVISCGAGNSYGHPHKEVLDRLDEMGFSQNNVLRTDISGDIVMSIKYDEAAKKYILFFGSEAVHTADGGIKVTWLEIAIAIIVLSAIVLIIVPVFETTMSGK